MTDKDGKTIAKYKYDAWGNSTYKWGTTGTGSEIVDLNPYRYSGYWYDSEIDRYYLKARYYDASIGRFLAKDPIAVRIGKNLSLNAYTYAINNPVMFVDPSGLANERGAGGSGYGYNITFWEFLKYGPIQIYHYVFRTLKNESAAVSIDEAESKGYQLMSKEDSVYHQIGTGNENNTKYIGPEGHLEQVFHEDGSVVTDSINMGTYNYYNPQESPFMHLIYDIAPYVVFGNTDDDSGFNDSFIRWKISAKEGWKRLRKNFN